MGRAGNWRTERVSVELQRNVQTVPTDARYGGVRGAGGCWRCPSGIVLQVGSGWGREQKDTVAVLRGGF
jgi:hypothetical protein